VRIPLLFKGTSRAVPDKMNAELCQLREQRNALEVLAEALRTQDG
jgi:hypothetical protein